MKKLVKNYEKNKVEANKIKFEHYPTKLQLDSCESKKEFEIYFESINDINYFNLMIFLIQIF